MTVRDIDRFRRVEALFDAALEYPPGAERDAYVIRQSADDAVLIDEVRKLLKDHERVSEAAPPQPETLPQFGPWRAIRLLGRGRNGDGLSGRTCRWRVSDVGGCKSGAAGSRLVDIEDRFRRERQFLASLDHPKIARLIDGGVTGTGLPYLVMEFVDGSPSTGIAIDAVGRARQSRTDAAGLRGADLRPRPAGDSSRPEAVKHRSRRGGQMRSSWISARRDWWTRAGITAITKTGFSRSLRNTPVRNRCRVSA